MRLSGLLLLLALPLAQAAQPVTVAVASNFQGPARELANHFHRVTGTEVRIMTGSTGQLYAHIVNGAPFDVFLAADQRRPQRLEDAGYVVKDARFTYTTGVLVLWSVTRDDCEAALRDPNSNHVAIANPAIAPFGVAAKEYLKSQGLWDEIEPRLVYGENVMQVALFVATGNADVGLTADSVLTQDHLSQGGCKIAVPPETYTPVRQDAVLLTRAAGSDGAKQFFEFLQTYLSRTTNGASGTEAVN
ncbi:MAG: molybdate ABC transporter substrate-binding protein [Woeseiaceae bacterium]|nr:molybdate ABC transporter substrate-binding protein [Woeseiaceae bacterium]